MDLPLPLPALVGAAALVLAVAALLARARSRTVVPAGKPASTSVDLAATASDAAAADGRPRVTILFGTQTGTAERFAKTLKADLAGLAGPDGAVVDVVDCEEYDAAARLPSEALVLFLVATYGDGEPTDNAADLYNWVLRAAADREKGIGEPLLASVSFGVFGLGNKQYEHFCAVGKRLHKAMAALGATPIVRRGDGDDDDDIEGDYDAWRGDLMDALKAAPALPGRGADGAAAPTSDAAAAAAPLPAFIVTPAPAGTAPAPRATGGGASAHGPALATVLAVRELHAPASDRSCVHVEIDTAGTDAAYVAGDHVGVLPENEAAVVDEAAALLGLDAAALASVVTFAAPPDTPASDLHHPIPGPITLRAALAWHADLVGPVAKPTVAAFARAASGDEAARLAALLAPDAVAAYRAWQAHSRCLLEVMREFPATAAAVGVGAFFASVAPRLAVRFYSISSSPAAHPTSLTVTCSVVRETTATGRAHRGVASHGLAGARPGDAVPIFIRKSTFRLPADPASTPIVMIGPGTGLAPFRGFLQDRAAALAAGATLAPAVLFFGCRSKAADYIYADELASFVASGALSTLHVAFSRDGKNKDYVQHHLARAAADVKALIADKGACVYVCGDAKAMAKDVHGALRDVLGGGDAGDAALKALAEGGRYHKDVW